MGKPAATKVRHEGYWRPAERVGSDGPGLSVDRLVQLSWQRYETRSAAVKAAKGIIDGRPAPRRRHERRAASDDKYTREPKMTKVIGGYIPPKEHAKLIVEDAVDHVLDKLIFAKPVVVKNARTDCLFMPNDMGPMWMHLDDGDLSYWNPSEVNHPQLVWPVSVGAVWPKIDESGAATLSCNFWKSVKPEELRGHYRYVGRHNLAFYHGQFLKGLDFIAAVEYGSWVAGRWRSSQRIRYDEAFIQGVKGAGMAPIARYVDRGEEDIGLRCAMGQSIALTYRYEWGAQFSIDNSAKVIVPTTPEGVLDLFNDRDKPEDRDRRSALRHWVKSHRRTQKGRDFSDVRSHLRGQTAFKWRGFDVTIRPSQFDVERSQPKP